MSTDTPKIINKKDKAVEDFIAQNMDAYNEYVKKSKETRSSELISNSHPEHAKILIRHLIDDANDLIKLISDELTPDIYDDDEVVNALIRFLKNKKGNIRVLLHDTTRVKEIFNGKFPKSKFLQYCLENKESCKIKVIKNDSKQDLQSHWLVTDTHAYRFCGHRGSFEAVATFNRPEKAEYLASEFDSFFEAGEDLVAFIGESIPANSNQSVVATSH